MAASRTISIRLGIDGAAEASKALDAFGQIGVEATDTLRASLTALAANDSVTKLSTSLGAAAAKIGAAQQALASAQSSGAVDAIAAAQARLTAATDAYVKLQDQALAKTAPEIAAQQQLAKAPCGRRRGPAPGRSLDRPGLRRHRAGPGAV